MTLESGTRRIVQLAWSRLLGLPDDALDRADRRVDVVDDTADTVAFVRLFGRSVLVAPGWLVSAASRLDEEVLTLESALLRLCADHGGRGRGEHELYFAEDVPPVEPSDEVAVSLDPADARAVEAACPGDEVLGIGLSTMTRTVTLVRDDGEEALAAAGWTVQAGILADLRILVRPAVRRLGLGTYVAAVAAEEALGDGLVVQLRVPREAAGARAVAQGLGLELAGSQTTVRLARP